MPNYGTMTLEEFDTRGQELRGALSELSEGERSDERSARMKSLLEEVNIFDAAFTIARAREMREQERNNTAPRGATANVGSGVRDIGGAIMNHPDLIAWIEGGLRSGGDPKAPALRLEINGVRATDGWSTGVRDTTQTEFGSGGPGNAATSGVNSLLPVGQPIAPVARQARLTLRDLIPSQPTTLAQVPYVRELNPTTSEGGASAVAEGGTKPDGSLSFVGANAPLTVVAVGLSPSKQLWEDAPLVRAYINQRLPYLVKYREQAELLSGSGTWPDIEGILTVSGKQSQNAVNTDSAQTIGMAIAKIENVDGTASGVALNPNDAWVMFTKRAASGSGTFDAGNPFSMDAVNALTVWGLPTVRSRVHASGTGVVADFARGAMILDRQQVVVEIFPQHSDYAEKNAIYVRCEERLGLAIWRPDYFVSTTLQTA